MQERLIHDVSWACASVLMDLVGHAFREEEHLDLFSALYNAVREALQLFCIRADRQQQRLTPWEMN